MDRSVSAFDEAWLSDDPGERRQDAIVSASVAMGAIATLAARVSIRTHFWVHWSDIAVEHEAAAARARQQIEQLRQQNGNFAEHLGREMQAATVAIVASAFAIDAFYGAVKPLLSIPPAFEAAWAAHNTPRHAQVFETLKIGFSIGKAAMRWTQELKWLFKLRDRAVHFEEASQETQLHPIGTHTAPEQISYSLEATRRALDLLTEILDGCSQNPRTTLPPVVTQMAAWRPSVERILSERSHASY